MADKRKAPQRLEVLHPDCAGIDIGKTSHYVAVDGARFDEPVRKFGTFTADLEAMAEWLDSCGVREVAMESTGVYWIPAFEVLDRAGLDVRLVNARATKQVSGRKSDVMDCQWIRQLMSHGLLSGAFRVPDEVCAMRSYLRQRDGLVGQRSRAVLHIHKALTQMNVQLDNVLSDVMGKTGQLIVRAIVAGERDGARLAGFRDGRCKAEEATIAASLQGNWRDEHLFALAQALERHDALQGQVEACEARINAELDALARPGLPDPPADRRSRKGRDRALRRRLKRMLGVDLVAIPTIGVETALTVAAEVGADLSRFPSAAHFCSWLGLAPGTRISGDKRLKGGPPRRSNRLGQALRMAATTARRDKSAIGAMHRRRLARMDAAKAIKATAHQLARLVYAMLTHGEEYVARDVAEWEAKRRERMVLNLQRQAQRLELALVPAT
ncbi:MAG: IS110 family transposase [Gammaproteobacteria bacterium]|nr:IS110 family transposase [Gammaproteobacteria bacterium]MXY05231.1 IS110 family transposase [Gammaproteobacteria bacterium]MYG11759.1 IS110 family transposase [Gammaproteobacteria bacterium]MYK30113.1 IS110 family transposase [Gammaproteobacteria bacterium]